MPRSAAQSDFTFERPVELPAAAWPVSLPPAVSEASARVARWILWVALVMFVALILLCGVGLHIPVGE